MKKETLAFVKRHLKIKNILTDYAPELKNINIVTARLNGKGSNKRDKKTTNSPEETSYVNNALTAFKNDFEGHLGDNINEAE